MAAGPKLGARAGVLGVVIAGLISMGADPPPATPDAKAAAANAAIAKAFPTRRLYKLEVKGDLHSGMEPIRMCMGPEALQKMLGPLAAHSEAAAELLKGCTHSIERKVDGSMRMEMTCDRAAGAFASSHMVLSGKIGDFHQLMEMTLTDPISGAPRMVRTESEITDVGACPANMKEGEMLTAAGKLEDPLGDVPTRAAKPEGDKAAKPAK